MKKKFTKLLMLMMVAVMAVSVAAFTACTNGNGDTEALSGTINIRGSTSVNDLAGRLITAYQEHYGALVANVNIHLDTQGSGAGRNAVRDDNVGNVIGMASAPLTTAQIEAANIGEYKTVAIDAVVPIVANANPVENLTVAEIFNIFTGQKTQFAGQTAAIRPVLREFGSGTREAFEDSIRGDFGENTNVTLRSLRLIYTGPGSTNAGEGGNPDGTTTAIDIDASMFHGTSAVLTAVAGNNSAIGYVSLSSAAANTDRVRALSVNGVAPTAVNVVNETFPISRPFVFFTRDDTVTAATLHFMNFLLSDAAQDIVAAAGLVPVA